MVFLLLQVAEVKLHRFFC